MTSESKYRRLGSFMIAFCAVWTFAAPGARAEGQDDEKLKMKADRYARRLLENKKSSRSLSNLAEIALKPPEVREVYYESVMAVADSYLEANEDGPLAKTARFLLCGAESCRPATDAVEGRAPADSGGDQIYEAGDVDSKPRKLSARMAAQSPVAVQARIQGQVVLKTIVDERGDVRVVEIVKGLPLGVTESAVAAMEQWKFKPAILNGQPVAVYMEYSMNFRFQ